MRLRLAAAVEALQRELPDFHFRQPQGGASIWVQAPDWVDAGELAMAARRHGVLIEPDCACRRLHQSAFLPASRRWPRPWTVWRAPVVCTDPDLEQFQCREHLQWAPRGKTRGLWLHRERCAGP